MVDIHLEKINETHCKIDTQASIMQEITQFFTFEVPGYRFMPKFKKGIWDGKIRLINTNYGLIYIGLVYELMCWAKKEGYTVSIGEGVFSPISDAKNTGEWIRKQVLTDSDGNNISVRDSQFKAVEECLRWGRRTIVSPTASGKSLMIYLVTKFLLEEMNARVLIVVPTTSLVEQMSGDFADYSQDNGFDPNSLTHKIYEGATKETDRPIVISTWQSCYKKSREWFNQFDCIIGDECHQYKADCIKGILEKSTTTKYRFGFTGTLTADGLACNRMIIEGLFGPAIQVATTKELIEKKEISPLQISIMNFKYSEDDCKAVKSIEYKDEIKFLETHKNRNKTIAKLALSEPGNVLLLFGRIKHGRFLEELINQQNINRKKIFFISGANKVEEREEIRKILENNSNVVLIASHGVFGTGVSVKNIHTIIFSVPNKSMIRVCQSIGRGLRKHKSKSHLHLIDVVDNMQHGKKLNFALKHGAVRLKIYDTEEFDYCFKNQEIS